MTAAALCAHRITIVTGYYGTGKTVFSVNLALSSAARHGLRAINLPVKTCGGLTVFMPVRCLSPVGSCLSVHFND